MISPHTSLGGRRISRRLHFDSAIADFTKAIELKPNNDSAYTNRGSAHYEKAEFDRAIADFTKAIEINPRSALAYCNLGWILRGDRRRTRGDRPLPKGA